MLILDTPFKSSKREANRSALTGELGLGCIGFNHVRICKETAFYNAFACKSCA